MERYIYINVTYDGATLTQVEALSYDEELEYLEIKLLVLYLRLVA